MKNANKETAKHKNTRTVGLVPLYYSVRGQVLAYGLQGSWASKNCWSSDRNPAVSLKEAREHREAAKKLLVDNISKQEAKAITASAAKNSFQTIALEWLEKYPSTGQLLQVPHSAPHGKYVFPPLGKRPIKSISAPELLKILRRAETKVPVSWRIKL